MSKQDITITITTIVADYDHAGQVLSLAQTVDNYNLSHERSNHRSTTTKKMKKNEQKRNKRRRSWEIDGRRGAHRDGSSFYFLCPSSTIHCRPAGVTNESTSQRNIEQKQREREGEKALNSTGIEFAPHDPSVHFLLDRSLKCSIGSKIK